MYILFTYISRWLWKRILCRRCHSWGVSHPPITFKCGAPLSGPDSLNKLARWNRRWKPSQIPGSLALQNPAFGIIELSIRHSVLDWRLVLLQAGNSRLHMLSFISDFSSISMTCYKLLPAGVGDGLGWRSSSQLRPLSGPHTHSIYEPQGARNVVLALSRL